MQRLVAAGMQLRVLPHVPTHLTICDRRFAVVPIDPDDRSTLGSMFIGPSGALTALIELFECLWARAVPLGAPAAPDPASEAEARLVALLTAGMKDESIARELGVSQPTVTRRITRLLGTLDAASRFQAGVQAARRGLV
jgi:DNA-binding NarL/FixJ family response regulator